MDSERLFAYLDGKLSAAEQAELEEKIASDPLLQRELEIARRMHQCSPDSREVTGISDDDLETAQASGKLGRRVAAAFAVLVMLNVLVGIIFIIGSKKSEKQTDLQVREKAIRQQISESLEKTAETALPVPKLDVDEIRLTASPPERESMADNVVMLAAQYGGSATKAPADEDGITVLAELPASRAHEFRSALAPLAQNDLSSKPGSASLTASETVNIYVRITDPSSPTP
jgi:hypothetical protein